MQKLSKKPKTCFTKDVVFFTKKPTKLGLHFYDFSTVFYGFYKIQLKQQHYLRFSFANRPLERTQTLQLGPWAQAAARIAGIRSREGRDRPGKGRVGLRGSPTTDSGGWTARRACRRGGSAASGGTGRWSVRSGNTATRLGQWVARAASGDPMGGTGVVARWWKHTEAELAVEGPMATRRRRFRPAERPAHVSNRSSLFIGGSPPLRDVPMRQGRCWPR
jgi:hypothetical protein